MKDYQTPQKEDVSNRRSKDSRLKKSQKITKKNLSGAFTSVAEGDVRLDHIKELSDSSLISEISYNNGSSIQIAQSSVLESSPAFSTSSEASPLICDLIPTSKILTCFNELRDGSMSCSSPQKPDCSLEVDIVVNFLNHVRTQVLNSADVDQHSKKLLDALVKVVLVGYYSVPEKRDCFKLVYAKYYIIFFSFLLWSIVVSALFFLGLRSDSIYSDPTPT